jgi:ubiquitin-like-conjugating enzyme ATG3
MLQSFRSAVNTIRDKYTPAYHTSTFRATGEITPEEFVAAGDFLVYKFPSWSWSDASHPSKRAPHLPDGKQFLVTRGVPCRRRLGGQDVAGGEVRDVMIKVGEGEGEEEWLSAGGEMPPGAAVRGEGGMEDRSSEVRSVDDSGRLGDAIDEDEIPDMEDDEDDEEAIIRDGRPDDGTEDG